MAMKTDTMVIMIGSVYYKMQSECFNSILHVGLAFICIKMILDYNRGLFLYSKTNPFVRDLFMTDVFRLVGLYERLCTA